MGAGKGLLNPMFIVHFCIALYIDGKYNLQLFFFFEETLGPLTLSAGYGMARWDMDIDCLYFQPPH